jgi:hypothetical protein
MSVPSTALLAVFKKFRHLDRVLRKCETADDPIYRTCAQLWIAVAEAQTAQDKSNDVSNLSRKITTEEARAFFADGATGAEKGGE